MLRLSLLSFILFATQLSSAQVKIGEVLIVGHQELKHTIDEEAFQNVVREDLINKLPADLQSTYHLLKGDRGNRKGKYLFVHSTEKINEPKASDHVAAMERITSGSKQLQAHLASPNAFSEYHLIGAGKVRNLPTSGILGLHFIKVRNERATDFENLVEKKLHPAVSKLFPDMQMFYYKCVAGENTGSYLALFTIDSPDARHKYWPEGKPETDILKKTFKPLESLAKELGTYLEPGTFLEPDSGGAAAYWESKEWTDYVHTSYLK